MKAQGPPCVVCAKRVSKIRVTSCPWCHRVLCTKCRCPNRCWERGRFVDVQGGGIKAVIDD